MKNEIQRIEENNSLEIINDAMFLVTVKSINAKQSLNKVKEVLFLLASACPDIDKWPSDEEWSNVLPQWFIDPFQGLTMDELIADENLWDYGSWLEAMRLRGWQWWSSSCDNTNNNWKALLLQQELVYSIGPLEYLIKQSGATSMEIIKK